MEFERSADWRLPELDYQFSRGVRWREREYALEGLQAEMMLIVLEEREPIID
jgi:hypothetical protein